jgi:hypothetical protein
VDGRARPRASIAPIFMYRTRCRMILFYSEVEVPMNFLATLWLCYAVGDIITAISERPSQCLQCVQRPHRAYALILAVIEQGFLINSCSCESLLDTPKCISFERSLRRTCAYVRVFFSLNNEQFINLVCLRTEPHGILAS